MESLRSWNPAVPDRALRAPAGPEVTHVRGVILSVVKSVLAEGLSSDRWAAFLDSLRPETREYFLREVSDYEWVPMAAISEAAAKHPSAPQEDLAILRGALYADRMLTRNHQWMLKVMTPELLVRQSPRVFAFYHLGGEMVLERVEPGRATVGLRAKGPGAGWFAVLIPTWFKRSLERCGGDPVTVAYEPPDPAADPDLHHYWLQWG